MTETVIFAQSLTKRYDGRVVIDRIDVSVGAEMVVGGALAAYSGRRIRAR